MEGISLHGPWQSERAGDVSKAGEEAGGGWDEENSLSRKCCDVAARRRGGAGWDLRGKQTWSAAQGSLNTGVVRGG